MERAQGKRGCWLNRTLTLPPGPGFMDEKATAPSCRAPGEGRLSHRARFLVSQCRRLSGERGDFVPNDRAPRGTLGQRGGCSREYQEAAVLSSTRSSEIMRGFQLMTSCMRV